MSTSHRLEDYVTPWRIVCTQRMASQTSSLTAKASEVLPAEVDTNEPVQQGALLTTVNSGVAEFATGELLSSCLDWLIGQDLSPLASKDRIRSEVATGMRQRLPDFHPFLPRPNLSVSYSSWALLAAVGAVMGSLALAPLTWLLGQREVGLFLGSAIGSGFTIGLIAWLSQRPKLLNALQAVAGTATLLTALGGVIKVVRSETFGLLKGSSWIAGCWLVLLLARPRLRQPTRNEFCETLRPQIEQFLGYAGDLVLSLCWAHPNRVAPAESQSPSPIDGGLIHSLGTLQAVFQDKTASEKILHSAVRAVLQRVSAEGYEWETLPSGTTYNIALAKRFESFDSIEAGQQVETLEPALVRHGQVVKLGMIRSL